MRSINALWQAFFSKDLYFDAFYSWKGIGFLSLLLLTIIQTLIFSGEIHLGVQSFVRQDAPFLVKQIPPITFKDGKASTPEAKAYEVRSTEGGQLIAIIDTRVPQPPPDMGGALVFVAGDSVIMQQSEVENRTYDYSAIKDMVVTEERINYWLNLIGDWTAAVCAPFIFAAVIFWRLLQLLFFSLITLVLCAIWGVSGDYAAKLRLTSLALIPAIVLSMIFTLSHVDFFGISLLFCAIVVGYTFFGVNTIRTSKHETEGDQVPPPLP